MIERCLGCNRPQFHGASFRCSICALALCHKCSRTIPHYVSVKFDRDEQGHHDYWCGGDECRAAIMLMTMG